MKKLFNKNFYLIPFGFQLSLFVAMILIYELTDSINLLLFSYPFIIFYFNFWIFKNKKSLAKRYNIKLEKVCSKFYLGFLISLFVLLGITLLLNEFGLLLQCSGWFCGMDITIFMFFILTLYEISICLFSICFNKGLFYWNKKEKLLSIICFIIGLLILYIAIAFVFSLM